MSSNSISRFIFFKTMLNGETKKRTILGCLFLVISHTDFLQMKTEKIRNPRTMFAPPTIRRASCKTKARYIKLKVTLNFLLMVSPPKKARQIICFDFEKHSNCVTWVLGTNHERNLINLKLLLDNYEAIPMSYFLTSF